MCRLTVDQMRTKAMSILIILNKLYLWIIYFNINISKTIIKLRLHRYFPWIQEYLTYIDFFLICASFLLSCIFYLLARCILRRMGPSQISKTKVCKGFQAMCDLKLLYWVYQSIQEEGLRFDQYLSLSWKMSPLWK